MTTGPSFKADCRHLSKRVGTIFLTTLHKQHLPMEFIRDLYSFVRERRKWWLTPIILLLIFVGVLIVIGGSSAVAPFIYTLF
jgi:hypothetical protein